MSDEQPKWIPFYGRAERGKTTLLYPHDSPEIVEFHNEDVEGTADAPLVRLGSYAIKIHNDGWR